MKISINKWSQSATSATCPVLRSEQAISSSKISEEKRWLKLVQPLHCSSSSIRTFLVDLQILLGIVTKEITMGEIRA